jgi:nucleoside-diphosphate kinase
MALERTFFIIKPDAVAAGNTGNILAHIEKDGFKIVALHRVQLTRAQAEGFYAVHSHRPFFGELCDFMTRGPVVIGSLEKDDAVASWRKLMGATDPAKADEGTMRKLFGANVGENATHGSDSLENAKIELSFFFAGYDVKPSA